MKEKLTIIISTYDQGIFNTEKVVQLEIPSIKYLVIFQNPNELTIPNFLDRKDIEVIDSKTKGLAVSRNIGIENCTTPYALLSDDDVEYIESGLQEVLEIIEKETIEIGVFKIKTNAEEPEYNNYPANKTNMTEIEHFISSIEILLKIQALRENKIKFDERFGLGTLLLKGEEELLIHDLKKANCIGYFYPIYLVKHPYLSTGKLKIREWKKYFIKGAYHRRTENQNYIGTMPHYSFRNLKNKLFYLLGQWYIKFTK